MKKEELLKNKHKDLTTKQQSEFLKMMNDNLNKNLFCDSREPRGRKDDKDCEL